MFVAQKILKMQINDENIPNGYCCKGGYFVDFEERYAIEGRLLGRKLGFRYGDCYLVIIIPSVIVKRGIPELGIPGVLEAFGVDEDNWGKINNYQDLNKPETIHAWLSTVFVVCYAKEPQAILQSSLLQELAKKVVYALQIINPNAIRIPSDEVVNNVCEIKHSVSFNKEGRPQIEILIASVIDDGNGYLTLKDIKTAIRNAGKSITAPYEMLGNARMNLARHDMRAAVLNCATSIEVMLKRKVADYFDQTKTAEELQEYVFKQADGYAKLVDLCKRLNILVRGLSDVQEAVMRIRHRVIHGGYAPSYEEANKAYSVTRIALNEAKVLIFE